MVTNDELTFKGFPEPKHSSEVKADLCKCGSCGKTFKVSECPTETERDGWENPSYQIHECPECRDGGDINDYFTSPERLALWDKLKEQEGKR